MPDFHQVRFVLINTTHPGNIGATARALKNMGFSELYLVTPSDHLHHEARVRSSGADDVLLNAIVTNSFQEAIADCHVVIGTSARERALPIPLLTAKEAANVSLSATMSGNKVAVLFGQERMGLTNEELAACHYHLFIPCNRDFPSLNLAAAVQIIAYELYQVYSQEPIKYLDSTSMVTARDMEQFYDHLEAMLIEIQFLNPKHPKHLMHKLRRLFNRVHLEQNEMNILRGILAAIHKLGKE